MIGVYVDIHNPFYSKHAATALGGCWLLSDDCAYVSFFFVCSYFMDAEASFKMIVADLIKQNLSSVFLSTSPVSFTGHPRTFLLSSHTQINLRSFPLAAAAGGEVRYVRANQYSSCLQGTALVNRNCLRVHSLLEYLVRKMSHYVMLTWQTLQRNLNFNAVSQLLTFVPSCLSILPHSVFKHLIRFHLNGFISQTYFLDSSTQWHPNQHAHANITCCVFCFFCCCLHQGCFWAHNPPL